MSTHSAIAVTSIHAIDEVKLPTETPGKGEVLIAVEYSSLVVFDTYITDLGFYAAESPMLLGLSASGTVAQLGEGVTDLAVGDRVAAFTFLCSRSKGMQQFTIQPRATVAKLPAGISLASAATIPDNFVTAFFTLFNQLGLPVPEKFPAHTPPASADVPILIYGAGTTSGQYAVQLLHVAGYRNILATASQKHHSLLRSLGATKVFDYHSPDLANEITAAAGKGKVALALDPIATYGTLEQVSKVISPNGTVAVLIPVKKTTGALTVDDRSEFTMEADDRFPPGVKVVNVQTFKYLEDAFLRDNLMPKILPSLLESGSIQPSKIRLLDHGTFKERVEEGLDLLRNNKISGEKVVVKLPA